MASSFNVPPWAEQTVIVVVNIFVSFAAGCATEARKFAAVYKFAPLLPMISQFVLQPLLVSGLGRAFNLNPYVLVGMLLCATTPGGNGSNIAEVIFGGDVELGIFMTFCSTLVSAGAIPLNYQLLAVPLISTDGQTAPVPWVAIGSAAAILIGGASAGCAVRYMNDKLGQRLEYWTIKMGVALLMAGVGVAIAQTAPIWNLLTWQTFVCGFILPPWKFLATYGAARLCHFSEKVAETSAMEAGEQNIAVALAIISLAFPDSVERNLMLSGLMVYTLFNQALATPIVTFIFWKWGGKNRQQPPDHPMSLATDDVLSTEAARQPLSSPPTPRRERSFGERFWRWGHWADYAHTPWGAGGAAARTGARQRGAVVPNNAADEVDGRAHGLVGERAKAVGDARRHGGARRDAV